MITGAETWLQAWAILGLAVYGRLALLASGWRRRTRIVIALLAPIVIVAAMAWSFLRLAGGSRQD